MKMVFLLTICLCIFIAALQSVYLPYFSFFPNSYDFNISLIICVALFRPLKEGIGLAILTGFLMDNLSGGYFAIYILSYLWIIIITKWFARYLDRKSLIILFVASVFGVIIQNAFVLCSMTILAGEKNIEMTLISTTLKQLAYAICLSPLLIVGFAGILSNFDGTYKPARN